MRSGGLIAFAQLSEVFLLEITACVSGIPLYFVHMRRHSALVGLNCCACMQENLRQLCVFKLASEAGQSYRWWEYVTKFGEECTMAGNKYNSECAEKVCPMCTEHSSPMCSLHPVVPPI